MLENKYSKEDAINYSVRYLLKQSSDNIIALGKHLGVPTFDCNKYNCEQLARNIATKLITQHYDGTFEIITNKSGIKIYFYNKKEPFATKPIIKFLKNHQDWRDELVGIDFINPEMLVMNVDDFIALPIDIKGDNNLNSYILFTMDNFKKEIIIYLAERGLLFEDSVERLLNLKLDDLYNLLQKENLALL